MRSGWPLVAALAAAQIVSWGTVYYGFSLFVVPMEAELGWDRTATNGALALGLLVSGVLAYPVGAWIDRHGGRGVMTLGSALNVVLLAMWSRIDSLWTLYVVWLGLGAAMAATLYEPVFAVVTRSFPLSYRTKITGVTLIGGFASTVFIPLAQLFIALWGWRTALLALALCNLALALPVHALLLRDAAGGSEAAPPPAREAKQIGDAALRRALRHPVFWGLVLCFTAYYTTFSAMTFHIIPLLTERGVPAAILVAAVATIGPAQVAGRLGLFALGRRLPTAVAGRLAVIAFPLSVLLLIAFPSSLAALFAFALLYGAANGIMTIVRGTAVPDLMWREGYGAINGALTLPANLARAAAPFGAALLWRATGGYAAVLWAIIAGSVVGALGFWYASSRGRAAAPGAP